MLVFKFFVCTLSFFYPPFVDFIVSAPFCPIFVNFGFSPLVYFLSTFVHFQFCVLLSFSAQLFKTFCLLYFFFKFCPLFDPFFVLFCLFSVQFLSNFLQLLPFFAHIFSNSSFARSLLLVSFISCLSFVRILSAIPILCLYFVDF